MPLQLGGNETKRPQVVVWDPSIYAETQDAMKRKNELLKQGFQVRSTEDGEIVLDPPDRDPNIGVFRILSQNGDDRVIWDRRIPSQVKEAFIKFKEFINKGYTAYVVNRAGEKSHKIEEFDPSLQEILLQAAEVILVPRTVPG